MLEGKAMIQDTDMPLEMQLQAMSSASEALDLFDVPDFRSIAAHIKKEFDMIYGSGWQCVETFAVCPRFSELRRNQECDNCWTAAG